MQDAGFQVAVFGKKDIDCRPGESIRDCYRRVFAAMMQENLGTSLKDFP
jgi:hypothetical protein